MFCFRRVIYNRSNVLFLCQTRNTDDDDHGKTTTALNSATYLFHMEESWLEHWFGLCSLSVCAMVRNLINAVDTMLTMFGFGVPSMTMDVNNGFGQFTHTSRASFIFVFSMSWKSPWESHCSMATSLTIAPFERLSSALIHFHFNLFIAQQTALPSSNRSFLCQTKQINWIGC